MELFEVKVEIPPSSVDEVDNLLLESSLGAWNVQEDVIVRQAWVVGIFSTEAEARDGWLDLRSCLPHHSHGEPVFRPLGDRDWKDSYKSHFKASQFGRLHWVPVWEKEAHPLEDGEVAIWLDPGLAFGTGNHETTRLCAERLVTLSQELGDRDRAAWRIVDAGCGSGILALSAARLGFRQIEAFDNDPEAIRVSEENAVLNGLEGRVRFFVGDLVSGLAGAPAQVVLANIQADVLIRFAAQLVGAIAPGGVLILSGILAHENEQVRVAFAVHASGWTVQHRTMGEWSDVMLTRPR